MPQRLRHQRNNFRVAELLLGGPANWWPGREATRVDSRDDRELNDIPMRSATPKSASPVLKPADQSTDDGADSCRFATRPPAGRATL